MSAITQWAALIAALIHIAVAVLEMFLFERPWVRRFLRVRTEPVADFRLWAFAIGSHNVVAGLGTILGLIILRTGNGVVGETLVLAGCVFMFLGGIIMGVADALGFYPRKGDSVSGDIGASLPPSIALLASLI